MKGLLELWQHKSGVEFLPWLKTLLIQQLLTGGCHFPERSSLQLLYVSAIFQSGL